MESKIHSTIVITSSTIILISAFLIVIAGISTTTFVNVNAQSEGANQTMQQQEDPQQSANQTMEKAIQSANETGEDVGKVGSQVTEGAKDLIGSIGEKLQDVGK
jgi:flagellar basal body-associated protein FliL